MQMWNVLNAARWKYRTQKIAKNSPSAHHRTHLSNYIFVPKAYIDNRKNLLSSNLSRCPHNMVNFGPLAAEIGWRVWGTPANFNVFLVLALLLHRRRWTEVNQAKLCTMFGRLLGWYTVYTFSWALAPNGILPGAKFTLHPSLSFSYIGSVTARHSSSGRQPNCGGWQRAPPICGWAAITLGIGPHSSLVFFYGRTVAVVCK